MAVDTPARIAILGGGPIGIEAALYARYLGYEVAVYERGAIGSNVQQWGHVQMFTPFAMNCSPLGLAALSAQNPRWRPPKPEAYITGAELVEGYLQPLSRTDLLADHIYEQTAVVAVGRDDVLKGDLIGDAQREELPFRLLVRSGDGVEEMHEADVVIDVTGTFGQPNWVGRGGIPARGEIDCRGRIDYGLADVLDQQREHYAGRHTLVVGSGYSAATNVVALAQLAAEDPATQITWITRRAKGEQDGFPIPRIEADRLEARDRLAVKANKLAKAGKLVTFWPASGIEAVAPSPAGPGLAVTVAGEHAGECEFDRLIANVGFRPDTSIYQELQVHHCYATEGPMKLAAELIKHRSPDCLSQPAAGPAVLMTSEPHFYILGAKSYGRNSQFLLATGRDQIRDLFRIIGDRAALDLYSSF